jgi:hypothetical protein
MRVFEVRSPCILWLRLFAMALTCLLLSCRSADVAEEVIEGQSQEPTAEGSGGRQQAMILVASDDPSSDFPPYTVALYPSGNFFVSGDSRMGSSQGHVPSWMFRKIMQDAATFDVFGFERLLHLEDSVVPDNKITICDGERSVTIVYTPVLGEYWMAAAMERGEEFARQVTLTYQLGQRVLDLTGRDLR